MRVSDKIRPIAIGEDQVGHDHIEAPEVQQLNGFGEPMRADRLIACVGKRSGQKVTNTPIVFNDQDSCHTLETIETGRGFPRRRKHGRSKSSVSLAHRLGFAATLGNASIRGRRGYLIPFGLELDKSSRRSPRFPEPLLNRLGLRPDLLVRQPVARHDKAHDGIVENLVQRWLTVAEVQHHTLPDVGGILASDARQCSNNNAAPS
jgi:hypothetical protein